jgi:predicted acylesterase/phospholipase RssA
MNVLTAVPVLLLLGAPPSVVASLTWWVDGGPRDNEPLTFVVTARKEEITITHLLVRQAQDALLDQDDLGYFVGAYPSGNDMVSYWESATAFKILVFTYRNGTVGQTLEAWSKRLPEVVYEHRGRDLVIIVADDSRLGAPPPPSESPRTATLYRYSGKGFVPSMPVAWAKRLQAVEE